MFILTVSKILIIFYFLKLFCIIFFYSFLSSSYKAPCSFFSFYYVYIHIHCIYVYAHAYTHIPKYRNITCPAYVMLPVYVRSQGWSLGIGYSLVAHSSLSRVEAVWAFVSFHVSMFIDATIVQVMFRQPYWEDFTSIALLTFLGDTTTQQFFCLHTLPSAMIPEP